MTLLRWLTLLLVTLSVSASELHFALQSEPKTLDPLLASDGPSGIIRYLTGGVLIRMDRQTGKSQPALAESWKFADGGKTVVLKLRSGVKFSDGSPFTSDDVVFTLRRMGDEKLHSPIADSFKQDGVLPTVEATGPYEVTLRFPKPPASIDRLFDQLAIQSSRAAKPETAVLGPFFVEERKAGAYVGLRRNPNYWKKDSAGRRLPYLDAVHIDIQKNREIERRRFEQGELNLMNALDTETFVQLNNDHPSMVRDGGPSLDAEFLWFNQRSSSPIAAYKKEWFRSQAFRRAISASIQRADIAKLAYKGLAEPAAGPVSSADPVWFNRAIKPQAYDPTGALAKLKLEGFALANGKLVDKAGHPVEFSLVTNSNNKQRVREAALIEQDLAKIGVVLHIVTLDFPSLVERINKTFDYEAALLSFVNNDGDPVSQMNVWLSSAEQHAWNPGQKSPETSWETEIDRLMEAQAVSADPKKRKAAFDRVQAIVAEQAPFIYLVHPRVLGAVSPQLRGASLAPLWPNLLWNADQLDIAPQLTLVK